MAKERKGQEAGKEPKNGSSVRSEEAESRKQDGVFQVRWRKSRARGLQIRKGFREKVIFEMCDV